MIRIVNIVLMVTAMLALAGVYALKYSVEDTASAKAALERRIERQKGDLSLLKADWAYLNQPSHIEPIIERHPEVFDMKPISARQFLPIDAIPMRPRRTDSEALDALFQSLTSGVDPANARAGSN